MVDPLDGEILYKDSQEFKCCVEEDEDYKVYFQVNSSLFPAGKITTLRMLRTYCIHVES